MTTVPLPASAEAVTDAGQLISGGSATVGAGVGALGVLLQAALHINTTIVRKIFVVSPRRRVSSSVGLQRPGTQGFWHIAANETDEEVKDALR